MLKLVKVKLFLNELNGPKSKSLKLVRVNETFACHCVKQSSQKFLNFFKGS